MRKKHLKETVQVLVSVEPNVGIIFDNMVAE